MSALVTMNKVALREWQQRRSAFKEKCKHRRREIVAKLDAADNELRDHSMVEDIAKMQLEFVNLRIAQIEEQEARQPEQAPE